MPSWNLEIQRRLAPLKLAPAREAAIAEELLLHLDDRHKELIESGASADEAHRRTLEELDAHELFAEFRSLPRESTFPAVQSLDEDRSMFAGFTQDLRYGLRSLRRAPMFAVVAILTLAVGIGANTAVFSLISTALLRPLYPDIDRLVVLQQAPAAIHASAGSLHKSYKMSYPNYLAWSEHKDIFESVAAAYFQGPSLTGVGEPTRLAATYVSTDFLPMLGIEPELGRGFRADEEPLSSAPVVILSNQLWRSRFHSDAEILGRQIVLNDRGFTVVGVLPPSAHFLTDPDVVVPLRPGTDDISPTFNNMIVFAKLRRGLSFAAAMAAVASQTKAVNSQFGQNNQVLMVPLDKFVVGDSRPLLLILLLAVAAVLLISCANTANLILARGAARQKEIAIRVALGATRGRLIRQLLTESFLISFLGAVFGLGLLWLTEQSLTKLLASHLPAGVSVQIDATVLAFTLGISVLTGIVFGFAPALQASTRNLRQRLSATGRLSAAPASQRMRSALVIAEIAFSLALLAGAGLLLRSFARLMNVNKGFDPEHVLTLRMWPSPTRYADPQKDIVYLNAIVQQVQALPGVEAAGWISNLPLFGNAISGDIVIDGIDDDTMMMASKQLVGGNYFHAMRMPLMRGRVFDQRDTTKSPLVAIVDQAFVQRYLPGRDPLGQRVNFGFGGNGWCQIVGVVGSVKEMALDSAVTPTVYVPLAQRSSLLQHMAFSLAVRASTDPATMSQSVRDSIHGIDSSQIIEQVRTMDDLIDGSVSSRKAPMWLFSSFAAIALFLAGIGVSGLLSYWVTQRQEEIGMRLALGSPRSRVLALVLGHASKMIGAGLAAGIAISLATTRTLSGFLYQLKPTDLPTFLGVSLLLAVVALLACAVPVFRATRVDPLTVLRNE